MSGAAPPDSRSADRLQGSFSLQYAHAGGFLDGLPSLRVLCVDDYGDLRDIIEQVLTDAGYAVTLASSAEEGLERLQSERFHLVVSDYNLPVATGAWMLDRARERGLLDGTKAVVLTGAAGALDGAAGIPVLRKPIDVDQFLVTIYELLAPIRQRELQRARHELERSLGSAAVPAVQRRLELTLYVSAASPSSIRALRNLEVLLRDYRIGQVQLTIIDLSKERPASVVEDRIVFTPTLVKRWPEPRAYLLGNLENTAAVVDLIEAAGVERTS